MQAASGLMHLNRDATGEPRRIGLFLVDIATGLQAAQNAMAALVRAARTGQGRHVQVSMLETAAALQSYQVLDAAMFPEVEAAAFNVPTGLFRASDGHLYVSMLDDAMFRRLAQALERQDWLGDPTLATSAGRIPRAAELNGALASQIATQTVADWEALLRRHDVLHARAARPQDLPLSPQARHAGVFAALDVPGLGALDWPNMPGQAGRAASGEAPLLGQHTQAVLAEFGITAA
jgi:crotonobetainyl-CoA:carnitine CoA-transferase CaiB-like acyl-CoA transferase